MQVKLREGESQDALIRRFVRSVQSAGILSEHRQTLRFKPAHEARRDKQRRAAKRAAKRRPD